MYGGWWEWVESMGVATGCGCKEYRFPHTTYPYSSCICSFLQQHPTFCSFKKMYTHTMCTVLKVHNIVKGKFLVGVNFSSLVHVIKFEHVKMYPQ